MTANTSANVTANEIRDFIDVPPCTAPRHQHRASDWSPILRSIPLLVAGASSDRARSAAVADPRPPGGTFPSWPATAPGQAAAALAAQHPALALPPPQRTPRPRRVPSAPPLRPASPPPPPPSPAPPP